MASRYSLSGTIIARRGGLIVRDAPRWLGGVALCSALAALATIFAPYLAMPPMLLVLVFGMAVRALHPAIAISAAPGIAFSSRRLLQIGVALLGLRVVAGDLVALGWRALLLVGISLAVTVAGGFLIARFLRQPRDTASVAATSVAVCGASAALAASVMAPRRDGLDRDTTVIIIAVSLLSTAVMVAYPAIGHFMDYTPQQTSLLLGAAIHDVAQVVGAGFAISPETGVQAVTVKLIRVACLLPVVLVWGMFHARHGRVEPGAAPPSVPLFLIGFFVLAGVASLGFIPAPLLDIGKQSAGWALAAAVAAIGLKTSFGELRSVPSALLVALIAQTVLQLAVVMLLIALLFG